MNWKDKALQLAASKILVIEEVDQEEADRRMSICRACPKLNQENSRCTECGCFMEVKTKCRVNRSPARPLGEVTHCPLGKWGDLEIVNHYRAIDGKVNLN